MARYKDIDYSQTILLPISYDSQIIKGTFEYTLSYLIDGGHVNLGGFDNCYKNDLTGSKAYSPTILLKLILFAYSKGILSSRKIEELAKQNIIAIALTANSSPDHSTISNFILKMDNLIEQVFQDVLSVCMEMNLIDGNIFAIDGCKISSNASKEESGKIEDFIRRRDRLKEKIKVMISNHKKLDKEEISIEEESNFQKRIIETKNKIEKYNNFINSNEIKKGKYYKEVLSNITDNESAKMKSSHGVIQGYNGIAISDSKSQVILYSEAFGSANEQDLLQPSIESFTARMEKMTGIKEFSKGRVLLADTGSYTEENLKYLAENSWDAYVPDTSFRQRETHMTNKIKNNKTVFIKDDFSYDKINDEWTCPAKNKLKRVNPSITVIKKYSCSELICNKCKFKSRCIRSKNPNNGKTLIITENSEKINYCSLMRKKIDTIEGKRMYSKRMSIIEPVFGNITGNKNMNYFTLRTKKKVNIQWNLYSIVHNIEKIQNNGG